MTYEVTYEEFKIKARQYKEKYKHKWTSQLLKDEQAIVKQDNTWKVAKDYPIIEINWKEKENIYEDYNGNLELLKEKIDVLRKNNKQAKIVWMPKKYTILSEFIRRFNMEIDIQEKKIMANFSGILKNCE